MKSKRIGLKMRIEHEGKYCPSCSENSTFPILPKCEKFETREFCEEFINKYPEFVNEFFSDKKKQKEIKDVE